MNLIFLQRFFAHYTIFIFMVRILGKLNNELWNSVWKLFVFFKEIY
jgi:hypothetical protein